MYFKGSLQDKIPSLKPGQIARVAGIRYVSRVSGASPISFAIGFPRAKAQRNDREAHEDAGGGDGQPEASTESDSKGRRGGGARAS
jgi:hypothetical protein